MSIKIMTMVAAAILATATMAQEMRPARGAFPGVMPGRGSSTEMIARMISSSRATEKLGLTAEQTAKIKEIEKTSRESSREAQKRMRAIQQRQNELIDADTTDEKAVMAALDERFEIIKEMEKARVRRTLAIKAVLTPEQLAKAREEMKAMRERRMRRGSPSARPPKPAKAPEAPAAAPAADKPAAK